MPAIEFPNVVSVEVIPAQPKPADLKNIGHIAETEGVPLDPVAYVVKITLETMPPVTSQGFELYLDDYRVRNYRSFQHGIYFKVFNPRFFTKHGGKQIRYCLAGERFQDTGFRLPRGKPHPSTRAVPQPAETASRSLEPLPSQEEVLSG
jgi:hypothetical protein